MYKEMRDLSKTFIPIIALLLCGCNDYLLDSVVSPQASLTKANNGDERVIMYHSATSHWIVQSDDPYRLENVKDYINDYPNLKTDSLLAGLSATHYVLTVYPRNEVEIDEIEQLNDVNVSYIPFDYIIVPEYDSRTASPSDTIFFPSQEKYTIEKPIYNCDGQMQYIETKTMPVLYVVWPVDKALPEKYEYHIDYSVFIPRQSALYSSNKQKFEDFEKGLISRNQPTQSNTKGYRYFQGFFNIYDPWVDDYIPVDNLRLRFSLGSNVIEGYTNSSGYFSVYAPENATIFIVFQNDRWKMFYDSDSSESPIMMSYAILSEVWVNGTTLTMTSKLATIHLAANYYYNHNHGIPVIADSSIRIRISETYNGDHGGEFHPGLLGSSCIDISTAIYSDKDLFALVCHELGHYNHYRIRDGFINYTSVHRLFKESYAEYSGWFICRHFYIAHNMPYTSLWLIPRSNQTWKKTDSGDNSHYSPLFVDLIDDCNQYEEYSSHEDHIYFNNETISNIPHSIIKLMIEKKTWSQIKDVLDNYCNVYFSQSQYNQFVAPYDYYFTYN